MNRRVARVASLSVLCALAVAGCKSTQIDEDNSQTSNTTYVTQTVGAAGATIDGPDGSKIVIPAGALASEVMIKIGKPPADSLPALPTGTTAVGPVFTLEPHGQVFAGKVTVTLPGVGSVEHAACPTGSADASKCTWDSAILGQGADGFTTFDTTTFSLYGVVKTPDEPCEKVVSGTVCGTDANQNVIYGCTNKQLTTQTVCDAGTYCRQNNGHQDPAPPPACAAWETVPAPADSGGFNVAVDVSGTLYALDGGGGMWKLAKAIPESAADWVKDDGFAAVLGNVDKAVTFPRWGIATVAGELWVVGPTGFVGRMDAQGTWTKVVVGTTQNLRAVALRNTSPIAVSVAGDNGTFSTSTDGGTTFGGGAMVDGGGVPIGTTVSLFAAASDSGDAMQYTGGGNLSLFHGNPKNGWVKDSSDIDATNAKSDAVFRMLPATNDLLLATVNGPNGGHVLEAPAPADQTVAPIAWQSKYAGAKGGMRGLAWIGKRVFAASSVGEVVIRDESGTWTPSPTGFSPEDTDPRSLNAIVNHQGKVYVIGGRNTALAARYIGP